MSRLLGGTYARGLQRRLEGHNGDDEGRRRHRVEYVDDVRGAQRLAEVGARVPRYPQHRTATKHGGNDEIGIRTADTAS
jgi:hypothetical protein